MGRTPQPSPASAADETAPGPGRTQTRIWVDEIALRRWLRGSPREEREQLAQWLRWAPVAGGRPR